MVALFGALADHPLILLFLLVGLGAIVGHVSLRGISLGAAAVLFVGIAVSALGASVGVELEIPTDIGHLGLALFTFTVGVSSGPTFFHTMRTAIAAVLGVAVAIVAGGIVAFALAPVFGLTLEQAAGTFAGALTNTPALAAAGNSPAATVGYSVAYVFGVLGMLLLTNRALSHAHEDADAPSPLVQQDIRIEAIAPVTVAEFEDAHDNAVRLSRVRHEEEGPVEAALHDQVLEVGDVVTVVGPEGTVRAVTKELGHESSHHLAQDRRWLDFRRVTVSDPAVAGRSVEELDLEDRLGATISRVRRADIDMVAHPELVLQLGDRVRVVAPRSRMAKVSAFFGDSSRGLTIVNPAVLGVGMTAGLALGALPLPLPGGGTFTLGAALGALLVGLVLGRVGRIGRVVLSLPFTVTAVISELGLLLFLAQAGARSGGMILTAFSSGQWLGMVGLGAVVTLVVGLLTYAFQRRVQHMGGTRLSGVLAGTQTQPALLAYANGRTGHDFRVAMGYTTAYPTAMVVKIVVASVLGVIAGT